MSPAVENIVNRDFSTSSPNEKWLTNISEFATSKGKIYLSFIRDCYNDEIISYKIGNKPTVALANDTLSEAIKSLRDSGLKPIIHSDRGGITDGLDGYKLRKITGWYVQCPKKGGAALIILLVKDSLEE